MNTTSEVTKRDERIVEIFAKLIEARHLFDAYSVECETQEQISDGWKAYDSICAAGESLLEHASYKTYDKCTHLY